MLLRTVKYVLVLVLLFKLGNVESGTYEEETTMTPKEKVAVAKVKELIIPRIPESSYINNYIDDDLFWLKFVRAVNSNVKKAEASLIEHLKWREENNMDTILEEDWPEFERDFPEYMDGFSRDGKPVSEMWFPDWPVRTAVLAGKSKNVVRWLARLFEHEQRRLFAERAKGKKIAQTIMLQNLDDFSIPNQACPACLSIYISLASILDYHYPGMFEGIYFLNMPPAFDLILRVVRPVMRPFTRKALKSQPNRHQWVKLMNDKIEPSQRSVQMGGTIKREGREEICTSC